MPEGGFEHSWVSSDVRSLSHIIISLQPLLALPSWLNLCPQSNECVPNSRVGKKKEPVQHT